MLITDRRPPAKPPQSEDLIDVVREERLRYDGSREAYRLRRRDDEQVGTLIVLGVAALSERVPTDLPTLADRIDVDALSHLFGTDDPTASVRFEYADCRITVRADDLLLFQPTAPSSCPPEFD